MNSLGKGDLDDAVGAAHLKSERDNAGRRTALSATIPPALAAHYIGTTAQSWDHDGLGRVLEAIDTNGTGTTDDIVTRCGYDLLSRPATQGWGENSGSALWTLTSHFDEAGRRTALDYPVDGTWPSTTLTASYDPLSRLTAVIDPHGALADETISAFEYVGPSRMLQRTDSDGSIWSAKSATGTRWDLAGRRTGGKVTGGAATFFEEELFYDADDRVTRVEWSQGLAAGDRAAQVYHYDELSRLVNFEQGPWSGTGFSGALSSEHHWTLDEQGNWNRHRDETSGGVEWQPPVDAVNAYQSWPTRVDYDRDGTIAPSETNHPLSLAFDAARGFLHERETSQGRFTIYRHDALGRLSQVAQRIDGVESEVVRYGYSADGRLAYRKQASPAEELYLVSDGNQVVIERTASAVQRTNVWAGATLLKTRALGGLELHLHQDRLGSVVLATQAGGSGAELHRRVQFDPYGRRVPSGAWEGPGSWDRYGYVGARWDAAVGLYLMGARWYAPELGRFLELDPIGEGGGWNLYNYVGSSPTMWVDPTGLRWAGPRPPGITQPEPRSQPGREPGSGPRITGRMGPPCYLCDDPEVDAEQDESSDGTSDTSESEEENTPGTCDADTGESSGPTPEQEALSDAIWRAATTKGPVEKVVENMSPEDHAALAGKEILIRYGASNDSTVPADDGGSPARAAAYPEVQRNAERLVAILRAAGADATSEPLTEVADRRGYDATVIIGHNYQDQGGIRGADGSIIPYSSAGSLGASSKPEGVVLWISCAGSDFSSKTQGSLQYHSGPSGLIRFDQRPDYYVERDKVLGFETSRRLIGFSATGIAEMGRP